ncbi:MAG: hypothetical protein KKA19_05805 [Candidatus Margulisbacteria bacterium]|nr:hypothetical protein [Candidatus Margulisiibacteriota bacterium]
MSERVSKTANVPPKHGLAKAQQVLSAKHQAAAQVCPAEDVCKKIGNFREGSCYKGTPDYQKCIVATVILLGRQLGDKLNK